MPQSRRRHEQVTGKAADANFSVSFIESNASMFHHPSVGVKVLVGEIDMEHEKSDLHWTMLRRKAFKLAGGLLRTKIVVPDGLVYYSTCYAPGPTAQERTAQIRQGLIGRTGYNEQVSELVFDWFGDGDTVQVAVVGKETLREAVDFATPIGLNPVAFSAEPSPSQFGSEPFFDAPAEAGESVNSDDSRLGENRKFSDRLRDGGRSISALIRGFGNRRDRIDLPFGILSSVGAQTSSKEHCVRPAFGELGRNDSNHSCMNLPASLSRPLFGAVRSRSFAKRAAAAALAGTVQIAALANPSAAAEATAEPVEYLPVPRPQVLEPPVLLRPRYLGGNPIMESAEFAPEPEPGSELIGARPEDQPPTEIPDETTIGSSVQSSSIAPEMEATVSAVGEASGATSVLSGTTEEAADDAVAADNTATDDSAVSPEAAAAELADPEAAEVALEEEYATGIEFIAPQKRPESIIAAVAEYVPPPRPDYIAKARKQIRRSAAASALQSGPPPRPTNLKTFSAAYAGGARSQISKSYETVELHATENGVLKNARLILIGVMGKPNDRKALVRLKGGTLVSLSVGDRLDGGRVKSIHRDHIIYTKGKRTRRLAMPD